MNRKFQHAMLALSTTAAVFTLLLLVGSPVPVSHEVAALPAIAAPFAAAADQMPDDLVARRHMRHSRALIALPYFSFAQGLRRSRS